MKVLVHLHGYLKEFSDGPVEVMADTAAEAVEKVTRLLPGFKPNAVYGRHRVRVVGYETEKDIYDPLKGDQIHLIPQFGGGKRGGFVQLLLGVALVGVGLLVGAGTALGGILLKVGALMFLGGLAQLLSPQPEDNDDEKKNRYLGAPKNTVRLGTRIPILYGRHQVYGHYLSFNINAIDVSES